MKGGYSFVQENNSEKHVVYNSVSLIVPILNALAINYRSHPIHSITVHHVPRHVVLAAYQTRILLNGFRFPTSHSLLSDLPKSRLHVVVFVIQNRAAPMAHEQLIHVGLGTPRVGTLDQFPQFERVQLVMGRIISQMLQQVVLVAVAAIARHAKHQVVPRLALVAAALRIHPDLLAPPIHLSQPFALLLAHRVAPNHLLLPTIPRELLHHEPSSRSETAVLREMSRFPAEGTAVRVQ